MTIKAPEILKKIKNIKQTNKLNINNWNANKHYGKYEKKLKK